MLTQRRNAVFQMYARYYEAAVRIETEGEARSSRTLCSMKHVQEVFASGPSPTTVSDAQFVAGMALTVPTAAAGSTTPISADAHAEKLMHQFQCDVAISSSALLALFDVETDNRYGGKV